MRPIGLALIAVLLTWASPAAVPVARAAEPVRLAVAELASPLHLSGIAAKLAQDVVDAAAKQPETRVLSPAEVEKALTAEGVKKLKDCGGRPGCVAGQVGALPADRIVVGSLDRTDTSYVVKLYLIDLKAPAVVSTVDRSILIASRRLHADVAAAIPGLLEGKAEARGKLSIVTTRPGATVWLDGEVVGTSPVSVEGKPGKHTLKVSKPGYLDVERFVTITADATEQVALSLLAVPGAKTGDEVELPEMATVTSHADGAGAGGPGRRVPVASWVAGGAAVASAGVATYFAVSASSLSKRAGEGPVYGITRAEAITGKRNALVADVLFGVAGAAAVTAVVLGVVLQGGPSGAAAPSSGNAAASPQASLGLVPGGAALALTGTF